MTKSMKTHVDTLPKIFNSRKGELMRRSRWRPMWMRSRYSWINIALPVVTLIKQDKFYLQF